MMRKTHRTSLAIRTTIAASALLALCAVVYHWPVLITLSLTILLFLETLWLAIDGYKYL